MTELSNGFPKPYLQNRELSWLDFDERVLDQGSDPSVPLLERLNFVSIFWSNLKEFFMVRVGSLTDLSLLKKTIRDTKTGWSPAQQLDAIYQRCHELYPLYEKTYEQLRSELAQKGIRHLRPEDLSAEQRAFVEDYAQANVVPFLSAQIINARHPFPHLENGALYVTVRLDDGEDEVKPAKAVKAVKRTKGSKDADEQTRNLGASGVTLGLVPLPRQCQRVVQLPGEGFSYILLEHVVEMMLPQVFSMYTVRHSNIICITRNADIDVNEGVDEAEDADYREYMKRILKKRARLAPVRLEAEHPFQSRTMEKLLLKRLELKKGQVFFTRVPLDLSYTWGLASRVPDKLTAGLLCEPFSPQWPACLDASKPIIPQLRERDVMLSYPYESMDPFVQLLREAAVDPSVVSIKITLYRLASQSHLAEALIAAAENGKEVTALFELRARFDESNNIEWSQRFEEAGCKVIYGFRDYKVHSKICCITRQTPQGLEYITQLGTGNYNEKTAKLYTDFSYITCDQGFGRDAVRFFHNMALENTSNDYDILRVAPLQIKPMILMLADKEIEKARAGMPCGMFFKTNSVTDIDIIEKIVEAGQAGVPVTLFVRGICCLVPGVPGYTDNVRVVSIVGRLLEHSRIYGFGPRGDMRIFLSSADLMTRNMDKRIEIAWPVLDERCKAKVVDYLNVCFSDNAKLRELKADTRYTGLGELAKPGEPRRDAHELLIRQALEARLAAAEEEAQNRAAARHRAVIAEESRQAELENLRARDEAQPQPAAAEQPEPKRAAAAAGAVEDTVGGARRAAAAGAPGPEQRCSAEDERLSEEQRREEARRRVAAAAREAAARGREAAALGREQVAVVQQQARAAAEKIPRDQISSAARAVGRAAGAAAREIARSAKALSSFVRRN
ncbi:MAG: polyphosphate kinase 1 [Coriobacteriales bacterium]